MQILWFLTYIPKGIHKNMNSDEIQCKRVGAFLAIFPSALFWRHSGVFISILRETRHSEIASVL